MFLLFEFLSKVLIFKKIILKKKVSDLQKKNILESFRNGVSLKDLSLEFDFSVQTITRQIKKLISDKEFKNIKASLSNQKASFNENNFKDKSNLNNYKVYKSKEDSLPQNTDQDCIFFEVAPLTESVNLDKQIDISSKPLSEIELPNNLYLIVDKNIELEPKILKDFSEWNFLPEEDLKRLTIEIFQDKKSAQLKCTKNQKLIKVPNSKIFVMTSKILKSRGITRIIFENSLISI